MLGSFSNLTYLILILILACSSKDEEAKAFEDPALQGVGPIAKGCEGTVYEDWETSKYVLPYPVGKTYEVSLSHCGGSYHSPGRPDAFAIDFIMDIGETITASRAGKVVYIEESGIDGGFPNNLVIIKHDDGTFAQYMHLTQNGALVDKNQKVEQGEIIGKSGNTGLAGFPHLHLVMTKQRKYPYKSFPTTFKNTLSNERSLASGTQYPAYEFDSEK